MPSQLIRTAVQNLIGGVSQQPNSIRLEGMCEEQINAYSSIVDGLGKRQPTEHIKQLPTSGYDKDTLTHWIDRDSDDRYMVVINPPDQDPIKVFDIFTGAQYAVTSEGGTPGLNQDLKDYLKANLSSPREDLRTMQIGDTTLICNTGVTCKLDQSVVHDAVDVGTTQVPDWDSKSAKRAFLFMKQANFLTKYAVRFNTYTGDHQTYQKNIWDPPLHKTSATQPKRYWLDLTIAWVKTFNGSYGTLNPNTPSPGLSKGYGTPADVPPYDPPNGLYEGKQTGTVQLHEILQRLYADPREPLSGNANSIYHGGIQAVYETNRQLNETISSLVRVNTTTNKFPNMAPIEGTVMKLELSGFPKSSPRYREKVRLKVVEQGDSDGNLFAFSDEVQRVDQLPLVCENGHTVKISGIEEVDQDEYYVEFVVSNPEAQTGEDNMGEGYWKEGMKPLTKPALDKTTMPVQLKRVRVGSTYRFEASFVDWIQQAVGDEDSNPAPGFVDSKISDLFFWRNRLGILSGSRVIMSEADEPFNFYRTTVRQVLDSDPIDIDAGHSKVANLRYAVPLEEVCVLVTDREQLVLRGDPLLTPRTASVRDLAYFDSQPSARPIGVERGMFYTFPSGGGGFTGVNQLQRVADADTFTPFRSSGQVPRYIKGSAVELAATSIESVMAVRTDDEDHPERLYIHKWHDRGEQRLLSAWMSFDVGPPPVSDPSTTVMTRVLGMSFFDDDLYMLVQRHGDTANVECLERITFSGQRQVDVFPDSGDPSGVTTPGTFRCFLDRRVTNTDCTFAYASSTAELKVTLPYEVQRQDFTASPDVDMRVIERMQSSAEGAEHLVESIEKSGSVSVLRIKDPGQELYNRALAGTLHFFAGQSFTMFYEFSRPILRQRNEDGTLGSVRTGRYQLLRGHLDCEDSGGGQVEVRPALHSDGTPVTDRATRVYPFPSLQLGVATTHLGDVNVRDEVVRFGIYSIPDRIRLVLTNDTPYPLNPKSLEIEAQYSRRSATRRA